MHRLKAEDHYGFSAFSFSAKRSRDLPGDVRFG